MREKVENRRYFSMGDKRKILKKSDGKCCHCGQALEIGDTFTVEHVVPISKGGTNDLYNLVALCEDCNKNKSNYILHPVQYFKYLNEDYLKEVTGYFDTYLQKPWFSLNNFLKVDKCVVPLYEGYEGLTNVVLGKADYSDLNDVYNFLLKYNKKYGLASEELKQCLSYYFDVFAVYTVRLGSGEIIGVFVPSLGFSDDGKKHVLARFLVYTATNKEIYVVAMLKSLAMLVSDLNSLWGDNSCFIMFTVARKDLVTKMFLNKFFKQSISKYIEIFGGYDVFAAIYKNKKRNFKKDVIGEASTDALLSALGLTKLGFYLATDINLYYSKYNFKKLEVS